jgi:hypothetical protein
VLLFPFFVEFIYFSCPPGEEGPVGANLWLWHKQPANSAVAGIKDAWENGPEWLKALTTTGNKAIIGKIVSIFLLLVSIF